MSQVCAIFFAAAIFVALPVALVWAYCRDRVMLARWPAMRVVRDRYSALGEGPFRAGPVHEVRVDRVIAAGTPWSIIVFAGPALMQVLMWLIASVFAARELVAALLHGEVAWPLLSSLGFSLARATAGAATEFAALHRRTRTFVPCVAATLALDALLYNVPIPVSDVRGLDETMALCGLALHAPLALAYAWAVWRRRGARVIETPALPPPAELGPVTYGEPEDVAVDDSDGRGGR